MPDTNSKNVEFENLKRRIHGKLVDKLDLNKVGELQGDTLRREIRMVVEHLCDTEDTLLNRSERERLIDEVLDETFGLGPLELLLKDPKSDYFTGNADVDREILADPVEYESQSVLVVPTEASWDYLRSHARAGDIKLRLGKVGPYEFTNAQLMIGAQISCATVFSSAGGRYDQLRQSILPVRAASLQ